MWELVIVFVVFDFLGLNGGDAVFQKQLGKYALALYQASGESAVIDLFATAARTYRLENGKFRFSLMAISKAACAPFRNGVSTDSPATLVTMPF